MWFKRYSNYFYCALFGVVGQRLICGRSFEVIIRFASNFGSFLIYGINWSFCLIMCLYAVWILVWICAKRNNFKNRIILSCNKKWMFWKKTKSTSISSNINFSLLIQCNLFFEIQWEFLRHVTCHILIITSGGR